MEDGCLAVVVVWCMEIGGYVLWINYYVAVDRDRTTETELISATLNYPLLSSLPKYYSSVVLCAIFHLKNR